MYEHRDTFTDLNDSQSLQQKIAYLHHTLQVQHPFISRVAIALYEGETDLLTTFVYSSAQPSPLNNYQARLSECGSLQQILHENRPRVVNDMSLFDGGEHEHTRLLRESGFRASYTLPLFAEGHFLGFLFFNAAQPDVFSEHVLRELDMAGHLIAFMLFSARSKVKTLLATVRSARSLTHHRDPETGYHLERMAHYARLIARQLASAHGFSDEVIEHIYLFAPLHDIGKLTIPDQILLKPGRLTADEFAVMKSHSSIGRDIIDRLLENYGLDGIEHVGMLRNIALYHHEALDGSGYPAALEREQIPIEARIVTVADVFDALTSERPYKSAWSNDEAFAKLHELAGSKLDAECVAALAANRDQVERVQQLFRENRFG